MLRVFRDSTTSSTVRDKAVLLPVGVLIPEDKQGVLAAPLRNKLQRHPMHEHLLALASNEQQESF
jgi:hypothetical protein